MKIKVKVFLFSSPCNDFRPIDVRLLTGQYCSFYLRTITLEQLTYLYGMLQVCKQNNFRFAQIFNE